MLKQYFYDFFNPPSWWESVIATKGNNTNFGTWKGVNAIINISKCASSLVIGKWKENEKHWGIVIEKAYWWIASNTVLVETWMMTTLLVRNQRK